MLKLGAIEAGGTKFVCGIGNENGEIMERASFETRRPEETVSEVIDFFKGHNIEAMGIGTFGPVDLDPSSPTYGYITSTPKPGWSGYDLLGGIKRHFEVPAGFDTDVNAAALGEAEWGAAKGLDSCVYVTIGTGIGAGAVVEGNLLHGLLHPEMGHISVIKHPEDEFAGACPFHGGCLEGMAAGPAIEKRWGRKGAELVAEGRVWEVEAHYLAQAAVQFIYILSPKRIIMGGGVMQQAQLFPLIRQKVQESLNGYVQKRRNPVGDRPVYRTAGARR